MKTIVDFSIPITVRAFDDTTDGQLGEFKNMSAAARAFGLNSSKVSDSVLYGYRTIRKKTGTKIFFKKI